MNERLGKEIERFCLDLDDRKETWFELDPHDKGLLYAPTRANIAGQIAEHFYNLALADVKGEVERIVEEETPISKGSDYYHGVKEGAEMIYKFIDNLTK